MLAVQIALGIATLVHVVPLPLAALHQAGAVLVFALRAQSRARVAGTPTERRFARMIRENAMTEPRALDEPLTDAELDELEGFLASDAVPEDCMDLEMLDGFLAAIVSGPESIQPSEWLPQVWSDGGRSATPAYGNSERRAAHHGADPAPHGRHPAHARRVADALQAAPVPARGEEGRRPAAARGHRVVRGLHGGRQAARRRRGSRCTTREDARDWIFPIEALAFGDQDPEFAEWIDDKEKRASLVEELAVASVLIYRFWQARRSPQSRGTTGRRTLTDATRKSRERLH